MPSYKRRWLDNNLIAIGFRKGYVSIISTHANEIGKEQFSGRFDEKRLISASYSGVRNCLAMVGERGLKILDIQTYKVCIPTFSTETCNNVVVHHIVAHQPE